MISCGDLEKFFPQKMLKIPQVFLRFFSKKTFQSLAIYHCKHLKLKHFGYMKTILSSLFLSALFFTLSCWAMFCPTNFNIINSGDSLEKVKQLCGAPASEKKYTSEK